ncbi:ankyrin repeat domain-containing protein [Flavobacteriaceae bacterium R33]|uniref:Ankyrin repeat domain-containing protein n=2 Tax=Poritiphilus flavus TaxID=2697053 RepID=A0A6L9E9R6_9FLAO|nr:ankyrin repeat domain-containing protein [Poritiphilus flavus]
MHSGIVFALTIFITSFLSAQRENPFLERAYWTANPSIAEIEQRISEGADISELNSNAFDPVSWALIEKVDNETIKFLLSQDGNGVNKLTHDGRTYIFWAAYKGNLEMMQYLVDNGAKTDIVDSHGYTLLNFAANTGQINPELYDFVIKHGARVTEEKNRDGANALLLVAPFVQDYALVDYFVEKGIDLKSEDSNGNGIFHYAAKRGNTDLLNKLIDHGVPHNKLSKSGENAFIFASRGTRGYTNGLEVYQYLEKLGINPNVVSDEGITPLHGIAFQNEELPVFEYFVSKGVDLNQSDEDGNTALLNAARRNSLEVVRYLAAGTEDINHTNKQGASALTHAIQSNKLEVVNFLLENGADVQVRDKEGNNLGYYLLKDVYKAERPKLMQDKLAALKAKGFNFAQVQENGNTLYHIAVAQNNLDALKYISSYGQDINARNKDGNTPLHLAAMNAHNDAILKFLIEDGADKSIKTDFEESAYDLAMENELLQKNNVTINFLETP